MSSEACRLLASRWISYLTLLLVFYKPFFAAIYAAYKTSSILPEAGPELGQWFRDLIFVFQAGCPLAVQSLSFDTDDVKANQV